MAGQMTAVELNKMRVQTVPDERSPEERKRARRKLAQKQRKKQAKENLSLSKAASRDRKLAIVTIVVIGFVMIGVIFVAAYCTNIKYDINKINKETLAIQEEIDYLKVEIENGTNIETIEKKALDDLGMIYPTADQFVYIDGKKSKDKDLAQVIKSNAYEF